MNSQTITEILKHVETPHNEITLTRTDDRIDMEVRGGVLATYHPGHCLTGQSWDAVTAATLLFPEGSPTSILMLGMGGATTLRQLRRILPSARLVGVEVDAQVVMMAEQYMGLQTSCIEVHVSDADTYVVGCGDHFDVVIDDLFYSNRAGVFRALELPPDRLARLRQVLTQDGVVVANLLTSAHCVPQLRRTQESFEHSFRQVRSITPLDGENQILVGGYRLADPDTLRFYGRAFPEASDQRYWNQLCKAIV